MGFACLCVVIIEVMFSEQPFYIVVTDEQNKVCTYVCVVFEKSINSVALVLVCGCTNVELIKHCMHSNYSRTKLLQLKDFIKICSFYCRQCMWSPSLYYIHTLFF